MPAKAGIHDFAACINGKAWMPAFVGRTGNGGRESVFRLVGMMRRLD
jgi:hypothetical protein